MKDDENESVVLAIAAGWVRGYGNELRLAAQVHRDGLGCSGTALARYVQCLSEHGSQLRSHQLQHAGGRFSARVDQETPDVWRQVHHSMVAPDDQARRRVFLQQIDVNLGVCL